MTVPLKQEMLSLDTYVLVIAQVLPLFILGIFIPPTFRTVFRMVSEKETRMRESMKMMGLRDTPYWMSWITYHTVINIIPSVQAPSSRSLESRLANSDLSRLSLRRSLRNTS